MDPNRQSSAEDAAPLPTAADALRIQVAAVAAQQIALDEEEQRLVERREALLAQEERSALHWEEKRRELEMLFERAQAERAAVDQDRKDCELHIQRITGDLSQAQREILDAEKHVHVERRRLSGMQQKLKQRWHRHWRLKQQQYLQRQREQLQTAHALEQREHAVRQAEAYLYDRRLRFNGASELSKRQLQDQWAELRRAQFRWRHRRGMERAALRVRAHQLEAAAQQIALARTQLDQDQRAWLTQRQALELELDGVNTRVQNQRQALNEQDLRLRAPFAATSSAATALAVAAHQEPQKVTELAATFDRVHIVDLDRLADELADQRGQLVEAWSRLAALHDQWHAERAALAVEIEAQGQRLLERDLAVQAREQASIQVEETLRQRHEDLLRVQHEVIAWRTQLRIEENAWETDKARLLSELSDKDAAAENHLSELVELRQRWAKRRKKELESLQSERAALELFRKDFARLRRELIERNAALDEEKRVLAEKALALEQYREQMLNRVGEDPQAERRLERLRRRWLTHNAEAIRQTSRERTALHAELAALEQRHESLTRQTAEVAAAEAELTDKQTAWEQEQVQAEHRQATIEQELRHAEEQRGFAEQQLAVLRDEIERIARALLEQPEPPSLSFERAA